MLNTWSSDRCLIGITAVVERTEKKRKINEIESDHEFI